MLYGKADVVEALLAAAANVNARSERAWTPLQEAQFGHHALIAKRLRKAGTIDFPDGAR